MWRMRVNDPGKLSHHKHFPIASQERTFLLADMFWEDRADILVLFAHRNWSLTRHQLNIHRAENRDQQNPCHMDNSWSQMRTSHHLKRNSGRSSLTTLWTSNYCKLTDKKVFPHTTPHSRAKKAPPQIQKCSGCSQFQHSSVAHDILHWEAGIASAVVLGTSKVMFPCPNCQC